MNIITSCTALLIAQNFNKNLLMTCLQRVDWDSELPSSKEEGLREHFV